MLSLQAKTLSCYCDHCHNNTCETHDRGLCYAELTLDRHGEIEKKFNCYHQESRLFQNIICDNTTKPSTKIIRCCNSGNYCNSRDDFLTSDDTAKRLLLPAPHSDSSISRETHGEYYDIPLEYKLVFITLSGLLLIFALALAQTLLSQRRTRTRRHTPAVTNFASRTRPQNHPPTSNRGEEDHSENSSGKLNSDAAVYDTNTIASCEPLISTHHSCNMAQPASHLMNLMYNANSLMHPHLHRGPYMTDETYVLAGGYGQPGSFTAATQSTFQMSIGSGEIANRPEVSSGSGAGQPYLTQRSIAYDIELIEVVGHGYYGVVWRGDYKGEPVAVKIFSPLAEPSWEREAEIYQTTLLRHKNILGFIATDKRNDAAMPGYWLVTDYYPIGSLYDFLKRNSMSMTDAVRMAFSIANGLAHLHVEIFGTQGKPAIAHRDLKSKNILVKNDGSCCIADLGMAVRYNSNTGIVDVPSNTRVGTRRYLAPELLDNKLNLMDFEGVKAADVYALGLVMWEILRRACFVQQSTAAASANQPSVHSEPPPQQSVRSNQDIPPKQSTLASLSSSAPSPLSQTSAKPTAKSQAEMTTTEQKQTQVIAVSQSLGESLFQSPIKEDSNICHYAHSYEPSSTNLNESIETSIEDLGHELAIVCDPYEAPYQEFVSIDPSTEEMRQVVCVQKMRPTISLRWTKFAPMRDYTTLMRECWYEKPQARLSALRIRKTLGDIARHYFNSNIEYD